MQNSLYMNCYNQNGIATSYQYFTDSFNKIINFKLEQAINLIDGLECDTNCACFPINQTLSGVSQLSVLRRCLVVVRTHLYQQLTKS